MDNTMLTLEPLTDFVGVRVHDADSDRLVHDDTYAEALLEALGRHGVLLFRGLHLEPEAQLAFGRRLGEIDLDATGDPLPGIMRVTLDREKSASAPYFKGTFFWHIDGTTPPDDECPQKATILTALAVAESGGETEFASSYTAYEHLSDDEKARVESLKVVCTLEASQRLAFPHANDKVVASWRMRKTSEYPLVWTHRDGRKSMVLGASTDHLVGLDAAESRALLDDLLARATSPDRVYRHAWQVGDTVMWDNRGVLHRAAPYPTDSPRDMLRTTILGDEPIE